MDLEEAAPQTLGDPTPALDAYVTERMQSGRVPGLAAAVIVGDQIVWARAFGEADRTTGEPMTLYSSQAVASITKTVTATALLHAVEAGHLDLDRPVDAYLRFEVRNPHAPDEPVTLRQILTHTSSLADGPDPGPYSESFRLADPHDTLPDEWAQMVFDRAGARYSAESSFFHSHKPGTAFAYANAPWALCAAALRGATGTSFAEYCHQHVLEPLRLVNSSLYGSRIRWRSAQHALVENGQKIPAGGFRLDPHLLEDRPDIPRGAALEHFSGYLVYGRYGFPSYPDGGLYSNPYDLARYLGMWMNEGSFDGRRVLSPDAVRAALEPQLPAALDIPEHGLGDRGYRQCLGWAEDLEAQGTYWHEGGDYGTRTIAGFALPQRVGVALIGNVAQIAPYDPVDVLLRLMAEFGGPDLVGRAA